MKLLEVRKMADIKARVLESQRRSLDGSGTLLTPWWVTVRRVVLAVDEEELLRGLKPEEESLGNGYVKTIEYVAAREDVFPIPCAICGGPMTGEARPAPSPKGPAHMGCADGTNPALRGRDAP